MHEAPIFEIPKEVLPRSGYFVVDRFYNFWGAGNTKSEAKELHQEGDLYRINVKLKENTNA